MSYEKYSEKLLADSVKRYHLSPQVIEAYRSRLRHLFVEENYSMEEKYADYPLGIYQDQYFVSTISQPSFVLLMLDMLDLQPGQKVFELGAGSGWNAALMGHIVGPQGKVVTVEIIPELAKKTRENLKKLGITNVEVLEGDGTKGYPSEAPFDRGVFTAGSTDFPRAFHEQIKVGGKLLFVLKGFHGADLLLLLLKKERCFETLSSLPCQFVPLRGEKDRQSDPKSDEIIQSGETIRIYPKGEKLPPTGRRVEREDSLFLF